MENAELLSMIEARRGDGPVEFSDAEIAAISAEQAEMLAQQLGASTFYRLPPADIAFFEWLREVDPEVWQDLWGPEEDENTPNLEPYVVGMAMLRDQVVTDRGFPICDLETQPNFYFTHKHILHEEAKPYIDALNQKLDDGKQISFAEAFVLELRRAPIDIWRFAYGYNLTPGQVKRVIYELVEGGIMQYSATRDELSEFLEPEK